jgi:cell division protein FtsB
MSPEIFDALESRIAAVADKLTALADRNAELEQRIAELEHDLALARDGGEASWRTERAELERRVEKLVRKLEGLAGES